MFVSLVVPVYNSTRSVEELARRVAAVFADREDDEYELLLVDDCSPNPETWPTLRRIAEEQEPVVAIQLTRNFGQQAATLCGLAVARGEVAITMDDDLQHDPCDIPRLLDAADHDIVIAQFPTKEHSLFKRITSRIKGLFDQLLLGKPRDLQMTSFRLVGRVVMDAITRRQTPYPFIPALLFHASRDVVGVTVAHNPRHDGRSSYTLRQLVLVFSNLIINNSSFMLRVVGCLGMGMALVAFLGIPVVIYKKLFLGVPIQGWASLFVLVSATSGMLLFSVGLIGEYLIRLIETTESKPPYVVRHSVGRAESTSAEREEPWPLRSQAL